MRIAALYVDTHRGPYPLIPGVECWGVERDASGYAGPWPVVAHPPCAPWGRFAWRASAEDRELGPIAVGQVRAWGGVLEHPAHSRLWSACGIPAPGELPDAWGGYTVEVEQVRWGHPATKATWIYSVGATLPPVPPLRPARAVICPGRYRGRRGDPGWTPHVPRSERHLTPYCFACWLVAAAESSRTTCPASR